MIRRPPRSTQSRSSAASDVYKRQDDNRMEEIEVGMAVRKIVQVEKVPSNLMFILYISDWIKIRGQQQMFCYLSRNSLEPYVQQWIKDLESSLVQTLINDACRVLTSTC